MFSVLITRPQPSASQTAAVFRKAGFKTLIEPLLEIVHSENLSHDLKKYQAVVVTSAMAIRILAQLSKKREIPLWCVGRVSCEMAKRLGYKNIYYSEGNENAHSLFLTIKKELNPKDGPIFYAAADITRVDLEKLLTECNFEVNREVIYQSKMKHEFSSKIKMFLEQESKGAVTFYSRRTYEAFLSVCEKERIQFAFDRFIALSLSEVISAEVEKLPWLQVITASTTAQLIVNLKRVVA
jgi:uroporphyrinogen-III synthase